MLAQIYIAQKEYSSAYALLNIVNLMLPNKIQIQLNMARCQIELNHFDKAKENIEEVFKLLPEHEEATEMLEEIKNKEKSN